MRAREHLPHTVAGLALLVVAAWRLGGSLPVFVGLGLAFLRDL